MELDSFMKRSNDSRQAVLKASRSYYAHRAYYYDLLLQQKSTFSKAQKREVDFLKHAFSTNPTRPISQVLDVACGSGRHLFELTRMGYQCTGLDFTPERILIAKKRANAKVCQSNCCMVMPLG